MRFHNSLTGFALICISMGSLAAPVNPTRDPIDTSAYYRLTNSFLGPTQALDVVNDGTGSGRLKMADVGNYSGQHWHFASLEDGSKYALRTQYLGEGYSLDVINDAGVDSRSLHLAPTGLYSGQFWTIKPWGDGSFKLTNDFTGPAQHLDTYSDTHEPFLGSDNHSGQHWYFTRIGSIQVE